VSTRGWWAAAAASSARGKPVTDAAERLELVEAACTAFRQTSLPQLIRLGIVEPV
jgi:hypothetical protein